MPIHITVCLVQVGDKTRWYFKNLSDSPQSRNLIARYAWLKTWIVGAEAQSKMASGTEEDDEELRNLILRVREEEDVRLPYLAVVPLDISHYLFIPVSHVNDLKDVFLWLVPS